jgi:hypothetical protein
VKLEVPDSHHQQEGERGGRVREGSNATTGFVIQEELRERRATDKIV